MLRTTSRTSGLPYWAAAVPAASKIPSRTVANVFVIFIVLYLLSLRSFKTLRVFSLQTLCQRSLDRCLWPVCWRIVGLRVRKYFARLTEVKTYWQRSHSCGEPVESVNFWLRGGRKNNKLESGISG